VDSAVERAVEGLGDSVLTDAKADAERNIKLRDMRDAAAAIVRESKLPEAFQKKVLGEFALTEAGPTPKLDQIDEIDGEGKVVKSAEDKVREAVEAEIADARELLAAASPTQVRGMGAAAPVREAEEGGDKGGEGEDGEGKKKRKPTTGSELNDEFLREARVPEDELDELYDGIFALRS
jgi:hypothetical protein